MTRDQRAQIDMFPESPEANAIRAAEATALRCRIEAILRIAAVSIRQCSACGQTIFFVENRGKNTVIPFQADGQSHFKQCPRAAEFSGGKAMR